MKLFLPLLLILTGCGQMHRTIDPAFDQYVNRWESEYGVPVSVDVTMTDLEGNTVGLCSDKGVQIDAEYWDSSSDLGREQLIYHEFGHCLLGLGHDSSTIQINGYTVYKSIMNSWAFGNSTMYEDNHDYYLDELKHSHANER